VDASEPTKAAFDPPCDPAADPANQVIEVEFTTVHPLAARVLPFSNPPSPAGSISTD